MIIDTGVSEVKKVFWDKEQLIQKWLHSRKIAILLICFIIADIALFLKLAPFDSWAGFMKFIVGTYMGANAVDGIGDAIKSNKA